MTNANILLFTEKVKKRYSQNGKIVVFVKEMSVLGALSLLFLNKNDIFAQLFGNKMQK